jgi:hypothetical protein
MQESKPTMEEAKSDQACQVIKDFFEYHGIKEIQKHLWDMISLALASKEMDGSTSVYRSNLLFSYEKLDELLENLHDIVKKDLHK